MNYTLTVALVLLVGGCSRSDPFKGPVDLAGKRKAEMQYYRMETRLVVYAPDGSKTGTDSLMLFLTGTVGDGGEEYTCKGYSVRKSGSGRVEIPSLADWRYTYTGATNEKGDLLGIDRSKFQNLTGSDGNAIAVDMAYAVYNSFIDFHTFCNVLAREAPEGGRGIQDLHTVGERVVHYAAFSEPPVSVGEIVKAGSGFKNGEITIELKGFSAVGNSQCALIGYDSGESSFRMIVTPTPQMEISTTGASHYQGDIYLDLESKWVKKATMSELVVSETVLPGMADAVNRVIDRSVLIVSLSEADFNAATK